MFTLVYTLVLSVCSFCLLPSFRFLDTVDYLACLAFTLHIVSYIYIVPFHLYILPILHALHFVFVFACMANMIRYLFGSSLQTEVDVPPAWWCASFKSCMHGVHVQSRTVN